MTVAEWQSLALAAGRHARAAVTVAGLPKNSTVEIQATVAIRR